MGVRGEAQRWCSAPVGGLAGLGGRPRISLPIAELEGLPLGLSLNGAAGRRHAASQAGATADAGGGGPAARCFEPR